MARTLAQVVRELADGLESGEIVLSKPERKPVHVQRWINVYHSGEGCYMLHQDDLFDTEAEALEAMRLDNKSGWTLKIEFEDEGFKHGQR